MSLVNGKVALCAAEQMQVIPGKEGNLVTGLIHLWVYVRHVRGGQTQWFMMVAFKKTGQMW